MWQNKSVDVAIEFNPAAFKHNVSETDIRWAGISITIDSLPADWLLTKAIAAHKTPADIISEMVRGKITSSL
jgi:hypothetical protein